MAVRRIHADAVYGTGAQQLEVDQLGGRTIAQDQDRAMTRRDRVGFGNVHWQLREVV